MAVIAEIRCAEPLERGALGELLGRSSWVWAEDRTVLEAHPDALGVAPDAIAQRRVRVAVGKGGELPGFSVVAEGGRGVCELDDLFVDPEMLRRGVGRVLVEDTCANALRAGGADVAQTRGRRRLAGSCSCSRGAAGPPRSSQQWSAGVVNDVELLPSSQRCHGGRKAVASALAQG
jgi:GNAT superfamily N-acetyltransferase